MPSKDAKPKADTGQAKGPDQQQHSGNGAAELAQALVRQLERIGGTNRTNDPVVSLTESRLVMHYGALSNALGNFGRHGPTRVALLVPSPELNLAQDQLAFPGIREATQRAGKVAAFFVTYGEASEVPIQRGELDLSCSEVVVDVDQGALIRTVEIEDVDRVPFLLGFVTTPPPFTTY